MNKKAGGKETLYPACFEETGKWGYINASGIWVIKPEFDAVGSFTLPELLDTDLWPVNIDGKWGYADRKSFLVIEPQFDTAYYFSDGISRVGTTSDGQNHYFMINKNGHKLSDDSIVISTIGKFSEGLALNSKDSGQKDAKDNGMTVGYINKKGEWQIPAKFRINVFLPKGTTEIKYNFSEGLAVMQQKNLYGFIDKKGNWKIAAQFDNALPFSEGLAAVQSDKKWGIIDHDGKWIVNAKFDDIRSFTDGVCAVKTNGFWGMIDQTGHWTCEPKFDFDSAPFGVNEYLYVFQNGLAIAAANSQETDNYPPNLLGYINPSGEWVIPPRFCYALPFRGQIAFVKTYESNQYKLGYINLKGDFMTYWYQPI